MPSEKPHRMRVRVLDGKPRQPNRIKGQLVPHVDVIDASRGIEFVIRAVKEAHLEQVRARLAAAGLEEVPGGDTDVSPPSPQRATHPERSIGQEQRRAAAGRAPQPDESRLQPKPYGFVPLPDEMTVEPPVWHDGTGASGRLSGEIRCKLETLTPLLVGWERRRIDDTEEPWPVPFTSLGGDQVEVRVEGVGRAIKTKSVLCPLRAPWGDRSVLLPGDSIKGLLRHELGALLGAPMERVAERSYSYRPNSLFPDEPNPRLIPRLARVPGDAVVITPLDPDEPKSQRVRVPTKLELLPQNLRYDRHHKSPPPRYRFDAAGAATYRGGQGAGVRLNSKRKIHTTLEVNPDFPVTSVPVPPSVQMGYLNTVRQLVDLTHGHFSERHPDVPTTIMGMVARTRILNAASSIVFSPGDLIWVEWDTQKRRIVSLGWHYYYRWAYADTVRKTGWTHERRGLFPLDGERTVDEAGAPRGLSAVRRLFGYTGDNDGSRGIGRDDHEQLMGRVAVNAAIEAVEPGDTDGTRFLAPIFLKELGMPRPSAVEHYLDQPYYPRPRPSDRASLVTYGDAAGYDGTGRLAGRKFYLDRKDAYTDQSCQSWKDDSEANRLNDRSTLALEASAPGRRFRFTVRFRDLDPAELAAVLAALCPHQFREILGGHHPNGYCSKLGYARPLGWGSVRVEAKALLLIDASDDKPILNPVPDVLGWMQSHYRPAAMQQAWLAVHRRNHPEAADYPRGQDGNIYSYHAKLRADHTRARRYQVSRR